MYASSQIYGVGIGLKNKIEALWKKVHYTGKLESSLNWIWEKRSSEASLMCLKSHHQNLLSYPLLESDMTVLTIICIILACNFYTRLQTTVVYHDSLL